MGELQAALNEGLMAVPRAAVRDLIKRKLSAVGLKVPTKLIDRFVEHTFAGNQTEFEWGFEFPSEIVLAAEDEAALDTVVERSLANAPEVVSRVITEATRATLEAYRSRWPKERRKEVKERQAFVARLEARWEQPLTLMRMILELAFDLGREASEHTNGMPFDSTAAVLIHLHARACQVYGEILTLLENGFADGAFSRWRTLNEIATVATFIVAHGEEVARRYAAHQIVERMAALRAYEECREALGYDEIPAHERQAAEDAYRAALTEFGKDFGAEYGWAAGALGVRNPHFGLIRQAAGGARMRVHYKLASFNVHAGAQAAYVRPSMLPGDPTVPTGATNAGLEEPAQNAALSLVEASLPLLKVHETVDRLIILKAMHELSVEVGPAAMAAALKLASEHFGSGRAE